MKDLLSTPSAGGGAHTGPSGGDEVALQRRGRVGRRYGEYTARVSLASRSGLRSLRLMCFARPLSYPSHYIQNIMSYDMGIPIP